MTQVGQVYQCDRCKSIMATPHIGLGDAAGATEHYCQLCWLQVSHDKANPRTPPPNTEAIR